MAIQLGKKHACDFLLFKRKEKSRERKVPHDIRKKGSVHWLKVVEHLQKEKKLRPEEDRTNFGFDPAKQTATKEVARKS